MEGSTLLRSHLLASVWPDPSIFVVPAEKGDSIGVAAAAVDRAVEPMLPES